MVRKNNYLGGLILLLFVSLSSMVKAQDSAMVIPLWTNGAPGFENRKQEPEQAKDYWVKNIHNPSLTVFLPPKDKATGASVVVLASLLPLTALTAKS